MNTKEENVLVKLVKKVVGLPTSDSTCGCAVPLVAAGSCCNAEAPEAPSAGCGCTGAAPKGDEHRPAQA